MVNSIENKGLTYQDLYTKNLKKVINGKNVILVVPPSYAELLSQAVKSERDATVSELRYKPAMPKMVKKGYEMRVKRLNELDELIAKARKKKVEVTDKLIAKVATF